MTDALTIAPAAADASLEEGFALAIRHRRRYRGDGPLEAWIWRLVVNAARS
jgi:DNA-directed RNA polymerase specialized sigma24 family protein